MKQYLLYITVLFISSPTLCADWRKHLKKPVYANEEERQKDLELKATKKAEYKAWKETTYFCELCNLTLKQKDHGILESHKEREHGMCHYCDYKNNDYSTMLNHVVRNHPTNVILKKHALNQD